MNPDRIYRQYRDDALAKQVTAPKYSTFVAMPFRDQFSYRSRQIYCDVIQAAAERANEKGIARRLFEEPKRVDDNTETAVVITEEIIIRILNSHFFIADLAFANPGVLLEAGIAMGLKSNKKIILITQGNLTELHFDIRNNQVRTYNTNDSVDHIASAFIEAAADFEDNCQIYIRYFQYLLRGIMPWSVL